MGGARCAECVHIGHLPTPRVGSYGRSKLAFPFMHFTYYGICILYEYAFIQLTDDRIMIKTIQLHIRIDHDTMEVLAKKAGDKGLTMSSYIRYLIHRADVEPAAHTRLSSDNGTSQMLVGMIGNLVTLFRGILTELGKTGNNLNQAVRDMNTSLKAGSKSVSRKDILTVEACSTQMSECAQGIWSGLRSLKQIIKEL